MRTRSLLALACAVLLASCGRHRPPTPPPVPTPTPAPVARWQAIADASHRASGRNAPLDGFVLGDVWGQWLGSPASIEGMLWSVNLTRVGVEVGTFAPWLVSGATIEQCLDSPAAFGAGRPVAGGAPLTTLEQLLVAQAIGVNVLLTIDSSQNSNPYHGATPRGLTDRAGTLRVYQGLLSFIAAYFSDTVVAVQVENEPCYRSYTPDQYLSLVRSVVPIVRAKLPRAAIVVGSGGVSMQCGNVVADAGLDVDVLGFHVATPDVRLSDAQLEELVRSEAAYLTSRYGARYAVWCDECGIGGAPHSAYTAAGAARLTAMLRGCRAGGCDGFLFLTIGGLDDMPLTWAGYVFDFALYSTNRGEACAAQTVRALSRQLGVHWAPGVP